MNYRAIATVPGKDKPIQVFGKTRNEIATWIMTSFTKYPSIRVISIYKIEEKLLEEIKNPIYDNLCIDCSHTKESHRMSASANEKIAYGACCRNGCECRRMRE